MSLSGLFGTYEEKHGFLRPCEAKRSRDLNSHANLATVVRPFSACNAQFNNNNSPLPKNWRDWPTQWRITKYFLLVCKTTFLFFCLPTLETMECRSPKKTFRKCFCQSQLILVMSTLSSIFPLEKSPSTRL